VLVGDPSTRKTRIIDRAAWPTKRIDKRLLQRHALEKIAYDAMPPEERRQADPPKQRRIRLEDVTIEGAQEVFKDSPDGVLCLHDELSGWFGAMDKYAGNRGGMKDRAFWLQAWNGGEYVVNRVGRGVVFIENLSASLLGGIQPDPMRRLAADGIDDGLLQRCCPVVLRPPKVSSDEPADPVGKEYGDLIDALHEMKPPGNNFAAMIPLRFDDGAQKIRNDLEQEHLDLLDFEAVHKKLAAHIGKYDGIFARLCVAWHCVEHAGKDLPVTITEETAKRVAKFLHEFMLPHAVNFYAGVLGLSDDHEQMTAVAGYILAHKLERITNRHFQRGAQTMRNLGRKDVERVLDQLDALGWLTRAAGRWSAAVPEWIVNPKVHEMFQERAREEATRRAAARKAIISKVRKMKRDA
jgi:hypothetical protein